MKKKKKLLTIFSHREVSNHLSNEFIAYQRFSCRRLFSLSRLAFVSVCLSLCLFFSDVFFDMTTGFSVCISQSKNQFNFIYSSDLLSSSLFLCVDFTEKRTIFQWEQTQQDMGLCFEWISFESLLLANMTKKKKKKNER